MKLKVAGLIGTAVLLLCFQNCSRGDVAFESGSASAASTSPSTDTGTTNPTPTTSPSGGDVLGPIGFTNILKVSFDGSLDLYWAGTYNTNAVLTLDHNQHSFNATYSASGLALIPPLSCHSQGTLSDYNNLENALENMTFSITHSAIAFDFITATLKIYLKDGTVRTYQVDTGANKISVDHVSHVDAKAFKSLIKGLLFNAGCSY